MKHLSVLLAASLAAGALAAGAPAPALADHGASAADRQFVYEAAKGGTEEVIAGRAQSKSSDANARAFGLRMVKDHSKNNAQLKLLAQETGLMAVFQKGVHDASVMPASMPPKQYLSHEVSDHQDDIATFQAESANGKNASIRAFARMTLPVLRTHLQLAQRLSSTP
jgi:putative membrane protein